MSEEPPKSIERCFPNSLADLGRATEEVVRFIEAAGSRREAAYAANLAIEEMITRAFP